LANLVVVALLMYYGKALLIPLMRSYQVITSPLAVLIPKGSFHPRKHTQISLLGISFW
jgi:hypothetical protein